MNIRIHSKTEIISGAGMETVGLMDLADSLSISNQQKKKNERKGCPKSRETAGETPLFCGGADHKNERIHRYS